MLVKLVKRVFAGPPGGGGGGGPPGDDDQGGGGNGPPGGDDGNDDQGGGGNGPPGGDDDQGGGGPPGGDDGQSGDDDAETCDPCGTSAYYSEIISTKSGISTRSISASGCPNHYSYCTGKDFGVCGGIGEEGSDTEAKMLNPSYDIPASPVISDSGTTDVEYQEGVLGVALNGVSIYGGAVGGGTILDVNDSTAEWTSFDFCSGHASPTGDYHYHFPPSCLIDQIETAIGTIDGHSPQIGWSLDGFPIYGPYGPGGQRMTHTSQGCTGTYCLDDCGGMEIELPDIDDFKYRYYFAGVTSDLDSLPTDPKPSTKDYPFVLKCYVGCLWDDLESGDCTGSSGVTDAYEATALTGYAEMYEQAATDRLCYDYTGSNSGESSPASPRELSLGQLIATAVVIPIGTLILLVLSA